MTDKDKTKRTILIYYSSRLASRPDIFVTAYLSTTFGRHDTKLVAIGNRATIYFRHRSRVYSWNSADLMLYTILTWRPSFALQTNERFIDWV